MCAVLNACAYIFVCASMHASVCVCPRMIVCVSMHACSTPCRLGVGGDARGVNPACLAHAGAPLCPSSCTTHMHCAHMQADFGKRCSVGREMAGRRALPQHRKPQMQTEREKSEKKHEKRREMEGVRALP